MGENTLAMVLSVAAVTGNGDGYSRTTVITDTVE